MKKQIFLTLSLPCLIGIYIAGFTWVLLGIYVWYSWICIIPMFLMSAIGLIYFAKVIVEKYG